MTEIQPKTWVEINQENLLFNIDQFRQRIGDKVKFCAVIKSDAYGHGAKQIATLSASKVDYFAVDSIEEAMEIKDVVNNKPILILGYTLLENLSIVAENNFHQVVANIETLEKITELDLEINIHLKIETGTSRQGILPEKIESFIALFKNNSKLKLAGVSTHFANIEDTTDSSFAMGQLEKYKQAIQIFEKNGYNNIIKHTASSAAAIVYPETYFDLVRVGIGLYGLWSSPQTLVSANQNNVNFELKPVLSWKTKVAHVKTIPKGSYVSYGCTERMEKDTKVVVLPIGYRDGFDRRFSSIGTVLINGTRCKLIGRVCMNMVIVNVDHLDNVKLEDEVILIGTQNGETITADEIASKIGTINYEIVTRINNKIKKIIL